MESADRASSSHPSTNRDRASGVPRSTRTQARPRWPKAYRIFEGWRHSYGRFVDVCRLRGNLSRANVFSWCGPGNNGRKSKETKGRTAAGSGPAKSKKVRNQGMFRRMARVRLRRLAFRKE